MSSVLDIEQNKRLSPDPTMSVATKKRRLELEIEMEKKEYNDTYRTCCSDRTTDARLLTWAAKFSMSMLALCFSATQIVRAEPCDTVLPFYTSLITFILGAFVSESAKQRVQTAK